MGPPAAGTADTAGTGRTGGTGGPGEARGAGGDTSGDTTRGGTGSSRGSRADGGEGERVRQQLCPILIQKKAIGRFTGFAPKRPKDTTRLDAIRVEWPSKKRAEEGAEEGVEEGSFL